MTETKAATILYARERYPHIVRTLTTAYSELEQTVEADNERQIHRRAAHRARASARPGQGQVKGPLSEGFGTAHSQSGAPLTRVQLAV